jgi:signal transduction histidine kinase
MVGILSVPTTNTFEGVLLLLIALAALIFMLPLKDRTGATWRLTLFFACMALLGFCRILEGTVGGILFVMLQDTFITSGGLFLVQFAYHFPQYDQPREARRALAAYCLLVSLSLAMILAVGINATRNPNDLIAVPELFWYLMPLAIVVAIILCLRRSLYYAGHSSHRELGRLAYWRQALDALVHPPNQQAAAHRNLALAISLGIMQAITSAGVHMPILGSYMISIGGLLVVAGIALVYYSHSLEPISFTARLVGISLTGFLLFSGISGIHSIQAARVTQDEPMFAQYEAVRQAIVSNDESSALPQSLLAYVLSWPAPKDHRVTDWRIDFLDQDTSADSLNSIQGLGGPEGGLAPGYAIRFARVRYTDFYRFRFGHDGRVYEVGFPWLEYALPILTEVNKHILLTVIGSLFVLISFPFFFRRHLFMPLNNLLRGLRQADDGRLDISLPIAFKDEIGTITHSFNQLMASLSQSNRYRDEYYEELTKANKEMEQRVNERTRELSETNRQLMMAHEEAQHTAVLQERQRLARDLHDAITQSLYGVMLFARAGRDAQEIGDDTRLVENLLEIENNALQTLKEMRLLLHQLRPSSLERGGLQGAFNQRFDQVERRLGIHAIAEVEDNLGLPRGLEEALYMIANEALNNSLKHSNSKTLLVRCSRDNAEIMMVVEDDGQGFDPSRPTAGMGLDNMHERTDLLGGLITIQSEPGRGTRVHLSVPQPEGRT